MLHYFSNPHSLPADEFNRLDERTLSAVSAQIAALQAGLQTLEPAAAAGGGDATVAASAAVAQVELGGRVVTLHPRVGLFVTMNPGYAGRSSLPDNLKALFRPVAMTAPDVHLIAQVLLYTQGFGHAEGLASRVTSLFASSGDQLSRRLHYDFGMRSLKTVLTTAGQLRKAAVAAGKGGANDSGPSPSLPWEAGLLVAAVSRTVLPKLVPGDVGPFHALLAASIPEATGPGSDAEAEAVAAALRHVCARRRLEWAATATEGGDSVAAPADAATAADNAWFAKAMQLYHTQAGRAGVLLVGPPGSGKTAAWRALLEALAVVDGVRAHDVTRVDPKACAPGDTKRRLYGSLDPSTLEWRDGLLTATLRAVVAAVADVAAGSSSSGSSGGDGRAPPTRRHWVVLDGDVDPQWAENLNSVLDDNR